MRKHVFGGLRTTKVQTSLRICTDWSAPLFFTFWKVSYLNLPQVKFQFLAIPCSWGDWFETRFFGNPEVRFSRDEAHMILPKKQIKRELISMHGCRGWSAPLLFAKLKDSFSRVEAHMSLTLMWSNQWVDSILLSHLESSIVGNTTSFNLRRLKRWKHVFNTQHIFANFSLCILMDYHTCFFFRKIGFINFVPKSICHQSDCLSICLSSFL